MTWRWQELHPWAEPWHKHIQALKYGWVTSEPLSQPGEQREYLHRSANIPNQVKPGVSRPCSHLQLSFVAVSPAKLLAPFPWPGQMGSEQEQLLQRCWAPTMPVAPSSRMPSLLLAVLCGLSEAGAREEMELCQGAPGQELFLPARCAAVTSELSPCPCQPEKCI